MELDFRQLNPHACKTYLIGAHGTNEIALVDPVLEHVQHYPRPTGARKTPADGKEAKTPAIAE
jgi:hypothetical protein